MSDDELREFTVMVRAGVATRLPNGCDITIGLNAHLLPGNFEVRGFLTERDGWVTEVVSYQNSGDEVLAHDGRTEGEPIVWHMP